MYKIVQEIPISFFEHKERIRKLDADWWSGGAGSGLGSQEWRTCHCYSP